MLNFASRYIPVYKVNMALLSESVLATIYAGLLLNEIPGVRFYIGAVLIILAIGSVFFARK
jgi:drug/metabolite transporter (DMT)-like permease